MSYTPNFSTFCMSLKVAVGIIQPTFAIFRGSHSPPMLVAAIGV